MLYYERLYNFVSLSFRLVKCLIFRLYLFCQYLIFVSLFATFFFALAQNVTAEQFLF